jgi:type VI protein secretion system component Hcp
MLRLIDPRTLITMLLAAVLIFPSAGSTVNAAEKVPSILLTLDGIQGSYSTAPYKGAIVVSSYSFGAAVSGSQMQGAKATKYQDFSFYKQTDDSSLSLLKALAKGQKIRGGTLYLQSNSSGRNLTYMKIRLTDIRVTDYKIFTDSGSGASEFISLQAGNMLFEYTTSKPDGSSGQTDQQLICLDKASCVLTQYHFDPIYDKTNKEVSYIKGFRVSLKATSAHSTVLQTKYRINGGSWVTYTGPFNIYAADTHTLEYFSTDKAGNIEQTNSMNFDTGTFTGAGSY